MPPYSAHVAHLKLDRSLVLQIVSLNEWHRFPEVAMEINTSTVVYSCGFAFIKRFVRSEF